MKKVLIISILILSSNFVEAQFIKEKSINAQIGYGISAPYNTIENSASGGFFIQSELILKAASWVEFRPYAGFILTNATDKDLNNKPINERVESQAFLLGGKVRVKAPIPWVAPYVEIGIGTSIGKFQTVTAYDNIEKSGIIYHIPFAFGLELGRNNNVDLGFSYYFQPAVQQYTGALAVGITIPLNKKV
ncbi:hypothetical protein [Bizionia echini]|uniref:hypothetical protein n=1 Tax=Bizionia echini TaxID=649333 RepID=UPI0030DD86D0|tara:strand:+ start:206 stop:775 length:570 start_codon:yes stop_codon:yes gene_type:complete